MLDLVILGILTLMIFYDFSLHVIELFGWQKYFYPRKNIFSYYWPIAKSRHRYNIFWTLYWGTAFFLIVTYILIR